MDVFSYRNRVIGDYASYVRSFIHTRDPEIEAHVDQRLRGGELWPEPRIALNPAFAEGAWVDDLVDSGLLHHECARIFLRKRQADDPGERLRMHRHQVEAIQAAATGGNYVPGRGRAFAYIVPIVDRVLRAPAEPVWYSSPERLWRFHTGG